MATDGDHMLGGRILTTEIICCAEEFRKAHGIDLLDDLGPCRTCARELRRQRKHCLFANLQR